MKVEKVFNPIKVVLETPKEAQMFWNMIEYWYEEYDFGSEERNMLIELSDMMSEIDYNSSGKYGEL